ncbi:hypothetical protein ACI3EY_08080 [Ornithinimicrobium sp. LYQ92]|uniref:hypothetical protein n=1 Tax=Serinicoccus sp. LYQ92 TaxID=3378798 RepID=UPI003853EC09
MDKEAAQLEVETALDERAIPGVDAYDTERVMADLGQRLGEDWASVAALARGDDATFWDVADAHSYRLRD